MSHSVQRLVGKVKTRSNFPSLRSLTAPPLMSKMGPAHDTLIDGTEGLAVERHQPEYSAEAALG